MADPTENPQDTPHFETDDVDANRAIEQGLGIGARELAAQREPGGVVTPDEDDNDVDEDSLDRDTAVQGVDEDEQLSRTSDA